MKKSLTMFGFLLAMLGLMLLPLEANMIQCPDGGCGGTDNSDVINGTENFNLIDGMAGDDFISAGDGRDIVTG